MKRLAEFGCYVWVENSTLCFTPANADGSPADPDEGGPVEMAEDPAFLAAANAALGTAFKEEDFA
jgi:hypothetical protein